MRATSKVTLQMGQVVIPFCKIYKAIEASERVAFNQLHKNKVIQKDGQAIQTQIPCKSRVKEKLYCPDCMRDIVEKDVEIVKGYEISKGNYVTITQAEIDSCKKESTDIVKIFQFISPSELKAFYFSGSSYIVAEKEGIEVFSLFYYGLQQSGALALAKMISRGKDNFLALQPHKQVLVAYDLYFPAQIRDTKEIETPLTPPDAFDQETVELMMGVIEKMAGPFNPALIKDDYNDSLRAIIKAKAEGKTIDIEEKVVERKVVSLKDALKGSLKAA